MPPLYKQLTDERVTQPLEVEKSSGSPRALTERRGPRWWAHCLKQWIVSFKLLFSLVLKIPSPGTLQANANLKDFFFLGVLGRACRLYVINKIIKLTYNSHDLSSGTSALFEWQVWERFSEMPLESIDGLWVHMWSRHKCLAALDKSHNYTQFIAPPKTAHWPSSWDYLVKKDILWSEPLLLILL